MSFDINKEQRKASNPLSSCWVSASAGSGKTKVLIDRVLRLLLVYGEPDKILCLTYTKTAAANMAGKINTVLKKWAVMPDEDLQKTLTDLLGEPPDEQTVHQARCLFALLLDEAHPIKMMTLHSFCQAVLKRFPLEAGVSPHFDVMDESKEKEVLNQCLQSVLENPSFKKEITILSDATHEEGLTDLFLEVLGKRNDLTDLVERFRSLDELSDRLKQELHLKAFHNKEEIITSVYTLEEFEEKKKLYLNADGKSLNKRVCKKLGETEALHVQEIVFLLDHWTIWTQTIALLRISLEVLTLYERVKKADCLLDYNDQIYLTKNLLEKTNMAAWVLFKLDGGIDHVLIDEAQDTNPHQWMIIRMLTEEFFSGIGRSNTNRTIFAVGDKKQSIFSFQGAEPDAFEAMRQFFQKRITDSKHCFETVPLNLSFRSTKPVLDLVNFLLKNPRATKGILWSEDTDPTHLTWRTGVAGKVEIWPLEKSKKTDKEEVWRPSVERKKEVSSATRLAYKIAVKIATMIHNKEILPSENRPVRAGDFLILFQRRAKLMSETVRALKEMNVPVAGVDRLKLTTHIAIEDLISLADFCLLPNDDLALACVLKSPLFNLSEEELFQLAYNRGNTPLFSMLEKTYPTIYTCLSKLIQNALVLSPFAFFTEVLSVYKGRQKFKERLGDEVEETLDEFLNLILTFQTNHPRALSLFIHWLKKQGNDIEIKRDLEQDEIDAVHIMTVHASKGLQGKIVFLPDTLFVPSKLARFVYLPSGIPVWVSKKSLQTPAVDFIFENLKEKKLQEYRRLLYVAITRASDFLFICGAEGKNTPNPENWYNLIVSSLPYTPDKNGIISFESPQKVSVLNPTEQRETASSVPLPDWATKPAPMEPLPCRPLKPSQAFQTNIITTSPLQEAKDKSLQLGTFIHRLLAYLPTISPEKRKEAALRLKPADLEIHDNIFKLLDSPDFSFLFQKNSLAEVPVVGVVDNQVVSGQIDRLVIQQDQVLIVDFKTNAVVPDLQHVPQKYKTQLFYYKRLISDIFPDRIIRTYLLWTTSLELMEIK